MAGGSGEKLQRDLDPASSSNNERGDEEVQSGRSTYIYICDRDVCVIKKYSEEGIQ